MKEGLLRIMGVLLTATMLIGCIPVVSTTASLEEPLVEDVIIAQETSGYKALFPDVVLIPQEQLPAEDRAEYPNGKLMVAYYRNTGHVPFVSSKEAMGTVQVVESKDNGRTWSAPRTLLTTDILISYGIGNDGYPMEARDPNFAILSDGTVILTFFARNLNTDSTTRTFITYSRDGGKTFAPPTLVPALTLDAWCAKRGDIAVFEDDQMLIPVYGMGASYNGQAGVNLLCTLQADGTFRFEGEYLLADSGTLGATINEVSLVATQGDIVYAMAREAGYVWRSDNRGVTWERIAQEAVIGGTQMHQPGLKLLQDGSVFATWTVSSVSSTATRPVYAKRFFPDLGWNATQAKLVYRNDNGGGGDMGDPSSCELPNGEVLVIYYVTGNATISGTFINPDDMLEEDQAMPLEASMRGQKYTYWSDNFDATALGMYNNSYFTYTTQSRINVAEDATGRFLRFAGKYTNSYQWGQMHSKVDMLGDYTATFDFRFSDETLSGQTEEMYISLLHNAGNTAIVHLRQKEIIYKIASTNATSQLSKTFTPGKWYSIRITRSGDGLYVRTWEKGAAEPVTWELEQHHTEIEKTGKFRMAYLSSNATDRYLDVDNLALSRRSIGTLNVNELSVVEGDAKQQLSLTFTPDLSTVSPAVTVPVTWTSTDTTVATVDNGLVTFEGPGTASVIASTAFGEVIDTCSVTVQKSNTAVIDGNKVIVNIAKGYELQAGTLVVTDGNGKSYIPQRVGFQNGGTAQEFEVNDPTFNPQGATVSAQFYIPTVEQPNIASIGVASSTQFTGLRFVSRFTRVQEDGKEYVALDGAKHELVDYGVVVASKPGMQVDLGKTDLTGDDIRSAMAFGSGYRWTSSVSFKEADVLYDTCDAYVDMALTFTNIKNPSTEYYTRPYVVVKNGDSELTLYGSIAYGTFAEYNYVDVVAATPAYLTQADATLKTSVGVDAAQTMYVYTKPAGVSANNEDPASVYFSNENGYDYISFDFYMAAMPQGQQGGKPYIAMKTYRDLTGNHGDNAQSADALGLTIKNKATGELNTEYVGSLTWGKVEMNTWYTMTCKVTDWSKLNCVLWLSSSATVYFTNAQGWNE